MRFVTTFILLIFSFLTTASYSGERSSSMHGNQFSVEQRLGHRFPSVESLSQVGNPGQVTLHKKAEDISEADVRSALTIPRLDKDATLFTAKQIGLRPGTTDAVGMLNASVLRNIPADCPGIKLDQMYYVCLPKNGKFPGYKQRSIVLDHDFVIDGEVDGKAVGGFHASQLLFYTEHSLNLRKVHVVVDDSGKYYPFYVNTIRGIDQLQVTGCVFEGSGDTPGRTFFLGSQDASPLDEKGFAKDDNCIRHVLFDGNTHQGSRMVASAGVRVTQSCRFLGNTIYDVTGVGISLSTDNTRNYAVLMGYLSCPVYIVGNTFAGVGQVMKKRTKWPTYYCAVLVESGQLYMLHNTIRNFVSGKTLYTTRKGERIDGFPETYDLYANVTRLYYSNNHVTNVLRFTKERANVGIFKAKGCCVPRRFRESHMPIVRYYSGNTYQTDRNAVLRMWTNRKYPADGGDYSEEKAYDKSLSPDDYLTLNIQSYTAQLPVDTLAYCNNTLQAVNIGGMLNSSQLWCSAFICDGNVFDSRHITSEEYNTRKDDGKSVSNREWLFAVRGAGEKPSVHITGNRFTSTNTAIRMLLYRYSEGEPPTARQTVVRNNTVGRASRLVLKSLNSSNYKQGDYNLH